MKTAKKLDEKTHSEKQAAAQYESIKEMVENLKAAKTEEETERAQQTIQEDALSAEVRSDWYAPGGDQDKPAEYRILLCWGGPACQLVGDLDEYGQPDTAKIEHQDWGTEWTEYDGTDEEILLEYARQFYFGE
jgi:hypothetical protein